MSTTSARYLREKGQIELALQMIAFEARTRTIRGCTGLSDDRIRRLFATYFKDAKELNIRRQRGKSPRSVDCFTRSLESQRQAATLASLLINFRLISADCWPNMPTTDIGIAYGVRFCRAYSLYLTICAEPLFCFERAWSLCEALRERNELDVRRCDHCRGLFVYDLLSVREKVCACCHIKESSASKASSGALVQA